MFRHLTKQLKRHRSGLTQAVALFFAATILIASIGRTKATTLRRLTPPPAATAGDGGLFSFSGDDWLVNLMLAAVAFAGTTSLLFLCAKRSKGTTPPPKVHCTVEPSLPFAYPGNLPFPAAARRLLPCVDRTCTRPHRLTEQRFWLGSSA